MVIPSDHCVVIGHQDNSNENISMLMPSKKCSLDHWRLAFENGVFDCCICSFLELSCESASYIWSAEMRLEGRAQLETLTAHSCSDCSNLSSDEVCLFAWNLDVAS